jgi:hypothetical protein
MTVNVSVYTSALHAIVCCYIKIIFQSFLKDFMFLNFNIHNLSVNIYNIYRSVNIYNIYRSLLCHKWETSNSGKCLETAFYILMPLFYFKLNNF